MFGIDLQGLILDAIPLSWIMIGSAIAGGIVVAVCWAAVRWVLNFCWNHRKALLVVCALVITIAAVLALV